MRTLSNTFVLTLAGAAALLAACSSSNSKPGGTDGGGGGGASGGILLTPDSATGFVVDTTGGSGIIGAWYAYGDSAGSGANTTSTDFAHSQCAMGGFTADQCSQITSPTPGGIFPPMANGMCTVGTAAQVLPNPTTAMDDYTDLFGAGIGLDFNNPGGDAGVKMPIDLSKYKGFSFDFSGDVIPAGKLRVNFPFVGEHGNDSPYFANAVSDDHSTLNGTTTPGHNTVLWANVLGPYYLSQQVPAVTPPKFDPSMVESIQFQVFTNTKTSTPYSFCVNNLTLLTTTP